MKNKTTSFWIFILIPSILTLGFTNLFIGEISVSIKDCFNAFFNYDPNSMNQLIIHELRIPRVSMAILSGAALAISGLLMQTLFNNQLAGPYVLGLNSGASLFIGLSMLSGFYFFNTESGMLLSALIGAFILGTIMLICSMFIRSNISLLLIGIMLSSFINATINLLETFAEAEKLKGFFFWSMGSLQRVEFNQLFGITLIIFLAVILSFIITKPLNNLVIGEREAISLGVNIKKVRFLCISITAILTGTVTAFCGPIAFIGLAVPNLSKIIFKTQDHKKLLVVNIFLGAGFMLLCDMVIQLSNNFILIPINVLTSFIGAPFIIYLVIRKKS